MKCECSQLLLIRNCVLNDRCSLIHVPASHNFSNCQVWLEQAYNPFGPRVWLLVNATIAILYTVIFLYFSMCCHMFLFIWYVFSQIFHYIPIFFHAMSTNISDVINHLYGLMGEFFSNLGNCGDRGSYCFTDITLVQYPIQSHDITIKSP